MKMRSFADRLRHTLLFEIIGLMIIIPVSASVLDKPIAQMGVVGVGSATVATIWNLVFNLGFDLGMRRAVGHTNKALKHRLAHTVLFEAGLLAILLPPMAWYLGMGLFEALVLDLGIVAFYLVYNFGFNVAYDLLFPVSAESTASSA